jgi:hypothetical protein
MEKRNSYRYALDEGHSSVSQGDIVVELDVFGLVRARAVDISLFGLGLVINDISEKQIENFKTLDEMYLKLHYGSDMILLGVKSAWNRLLSESGKLVFKSGVKITLISPEDKLKLSRIIEKIRNVRV